MPHTMTAKFAGRCRLCGNSFAKGERVIFIARGNLVHETCGRIERAANQWRKKGACNEEGAQQDSGQQGTQQQEDYAT